MRYVNFMLLWLLAQTLHAQIKLQGMVKDSLTLQGIPFANVILLKLPLEEVVTQQICNENGSYLINSLAPGKYLLKASALGYSMGMAEVIIEQHAKSAPYHQDIWLKPSIQQLNEVEITGNKLLVQSSSGKITYDAGSSAANQSGSALELTARLPGVNVDNNGNITVRGRKGARIWVDGRPAPLADTDPKTFLQSIPAASIAKVEIIHQPDAAYDSGGGAAIIHIYLKKTAGQGQQLRLTSTVGTPLNKTNNNLQWSYSHGQHLFYVDAVMRYETFNQRWQEQRRMLLVDSLLSFNTLSTGREQNQQYQLRTGYEFARKHFKAGAMLQISHNPTREPWSQRNDITAFNQNQGNYYLANSLYQSSNNFLNAAIFHTINHDSNRVIIHNDLSFNGVQLNSFDKVFTGTYNASGVLLEEYYPVFKPSRRLNNLTYNSYLKFNFNPKVQGQAGIKNETNLNNNLFRQYTEQNGQLIADTAATDVLKYHENIAAAYAEIKYRYQYVDLHAGLRAEHTLVRSNQAGVSQRYLSLFPHIKAQKQLDSSLEISLFYNRRIERPTFNQLNNTATLYDIFTVNAGNPLLRPQFVHNIGLECNTTWRNWPVFATLSYTYTHHAFEELSRVVEQRVYLKPENWGNTRFFALDGGISFDATNLFQVTLSSGIYYNQFLRRVDGLTPFNDGWVAQGNLAISYNPANNWQLQVLNNYNTGYPFFNGSSVWSGNTDIVVKKSLHKQQWQIFAHVNDVFNTNRWWGSWQGVYTSGRGRWKPETRILYIGLSYQWSKGKSEIQKTTIDENQRLQIKGGGR